MELHAQLGPTESNLTYLRVVQIISDTSEPFLVHTIDRYAACGVPNRITGIGLGSETEVISAINETILPPKQMRVYGVYVDGGDAQPSPSSLEQLHEKKVLTIDVHVSSFLRTFVCKEFGLPNERRGFLDALAKRPSLVDFFWDHEDFKHLNAIKWRGDLFLPKNQKLHGVRFITIRDPSVIRHVQCVQDTRVNLTTVSYD